MGRRGRRVRKKMSRRKSAKKRTVYPDPVYESVLVSRFISRMMLDGKRGVAEKIFYKAMDLIKEKTKKNGIDVFSEAIENVKPQVEVRSRRVGGAIYQVPVEVSEFRQTTLALRWLVTYSRTRSERDMAKRLCGEFVDACNKLGNSIKKKEEVFKSAESNKAFAHFRW